MPEVIDRRFVERSLEDHFDAADPFAALVRNGEAPPGVRLALTDEGSLQRCDDGAGAPDAAAGAAPAGRTPAPAELVRQAGWPASERADGSCRVELETRRGPHHAHVAAGIEGVSVTTDLGAAAGAMAPANRAAVAILMLNASSHVRLVRPAVARADGAVPRLEALSLPSPNAAAIDRLLSALSVACELCGPEVELLSIDTPLARAYLRRWACRLPDLENLL